MPAPARPKAHLVGMVHLPPLPGSPRAALAVAAIEAQAVSAARALAASGFHACIVENFGDAPFHAGAVEPITVAVMSRIVAALRREVPDLLVGVNVLRNDALAALAVAGAAGAQFVRVNVHVGATATDQGILEGRAAETLRLRQRLGLEVEIWADVHVKHGRSLAHETIADEARDAVERGLADAIIVTGRGTGWATDVDDLRTVRALDLGVPMYVGSGVTEQSLDLYLREADGVIVGSAIEQNGRAGSPLDPERARKFVAAARKILD